MELITCKEKLRLPLPEKPHPPLGESPASVNTPDVTILTKGLSLWGGSRELRGQLMGRPQSVLWEQSAVPQKWSG